MNARAGGSTQGSVRIIAGEWRGRKLPVLDKPGLRPTSDRVRETVFNWLQGRTEGARVLDVFAGTGALGFEALSRGAAHVMFLEKDRQLAKNLEALSTLLAASARTSIHCGDSVQILRSGAHAVFDLVFVDPPFADGLHDAVLAQLQDWTQAGSLLYLEAPVRQVVTVPANWREIRSGSTREVAYRLFQRAE